MRALQKFRATVGVVSLAVFLACSLVPVYIPASALGSDVEENELASDQFLLVEEGFVMKTASISEQGHRLAYSNGIAHKVGPSESLSSIADLYSISIDTIRFANDLREGHILHPGDTLLILPVDGVLHVVTRGQSLLSIASLYGVEMQSIIGQNQLSDEKIFAGQRLIIPKGKPLIAKTPVTVTASTPERVGSPPKPTQPPEAEPPASFGLFPMPYENPKTPQAF